MEKSVEKIKERPWEITEEEMRFIELLRFLDPEERAALLEIAKLQAEMYAFWVRASRGEPIEAQDVITRLINVRDILERSRFPTYPLLAKQVYLRLIAKYNPNAYPCRDWADLEAKALIAYKGLNWDAYVEMAKATKEPSERQQFFFGIAPPMQQQPRKEVKRSKWRFWRRGKEEESEFEAQ